MSIPVPVNGKTAVHLLDENLEEVPVENGRINITVPGNWGRNPKDQGGLIIMAKTNAQAAHRRR